METGILKRLKISAIILLIIVSVIFLAYLIGYFSSDFLGARIGEHRNFEYTLLGFLLLIPITMIGAMIVRYFDWLING